MAHHFRLPDLLKGKSHPTLPMLSLKLMLLSFLFIFVAISTFLLGSLGGNAVVPTLAHWLYTHDLANKSFANPTPIPLFTAALPIISPVQYIVEDGDSCNSILINHMHFLSAGEIFSDQKKNTVQALNQSIQHDCHKLDKGMTLAISTQYPLIAFGGEVLQINGLTGAPVPTPLIPMPTQEVETPSCSNGCILVVKLTPHVQIRLQIHTILSIHRGAWIWSQARMPLKTIKGFAAYPYTNTGPLLNDLTLQACTVQVGSVTDPTLSCNQITPNTIDSDGGTWLYAVTGSSALDHWHYTIPAPAGTPVLIWLSNQENHLAFQAGNPLYHYDPASHTYHT